ncbi:MAG: DUF1461 domain-containing protein [Coriobacteriia bacterium]|nr:DUF1461 domain-containing protein [Coriobacteriia bacterium]
MTRETGLRGLARAEAALAAILLAITAIGVALLPVTTAPCVRAIVLAVDSASLTGLGEDATIEAAEAVRVFVLEADAPALPETIAGAPAFDEAAVSHLVDVRDVLLPARGLTFVLLVLAVMWAVLRARTADGRRVVGSGLRGAALLLAIGAVLSVLVGTVDFGSFFSWFHSLFFEPGTWTFPENALLIRVFPIAFWVSAGALWGVLVLMSALMLFIVGRRLGFTRGNYGV